MEKLHHLDYKRSGSGLLFLNSSSVGIRLQLHVETCNVGEDISCLVKQQMKFGCTHLLFFLLWLIGIVVA